MIRREPGQACEAGGLGQARGRRRQDNILRRPGPMLSGGTPGRPAQHAVFIGIDNSFTKKNYEFNFCCQLSSHRGAWLSGKFGNSQMNNWNYATKTRWNFIELAFYVIRTLNSLSKKWRHKKDVSWLFVYKRELYPNSTLSLFWNFQKIEIKLN